jgi:type IVB pilus formation R64 PilN family outer membrane protein
MRRKYSYIVSALALTASLSACSSFRQADDITNAAIAGSQANAVSPTADGDTTDAPYLLGPQVKMAQSLSPVLQQPQALRISHETLNQIAAQISQSTGLEVDVDSLDSTSEPPTLPPGNTGAAYGGLPPPPAAFLAAMDHTAGPAASDPPPRVTIYYPAPGQVGTLGGALDVIAAATGEYWQIDNGAIEFFKRRSQTFVIPAIDWTQSASNQIEADSGASGSSGGAGGYTGGTTTTTTSGQSGDSGSGSGSLTDTANSNSDVWKGIEATAKVIGGGAEISADPNTSTLTVLGTPDQISQVSDWVNSLSTILMKTVNVEVHIYDVQLSKEDNYGIDPTLSFQNAAKSLGVSVSGASVPAVLGSATPFHFGASILSGEFASSAAAFQALSTLGKVTTAITFQASTLNDQEAPLDKTTITGYLAQSESSQAANVGTLNALQPGQITTGFIGSVKPLVVGGKIVVGFQLHLSALLSLLNVTSGGSSIQVPTSNNILVNEVTALRNGGTLMLSGYQDAETNTTHNGVGSPYMPALGGGGDAQVIQNYIAIVISAGTTS